MVTEYRINFHSIGVWNTSNKLHCIYSCGWEGVESKREVRSDGVWPMLSMSQKESRWANKKGEQEINCKRARRTQSNSHYQPLLSLRYLNGKKPGSLCGLEVPLSSNWFGHNMTTTLPLWAVAEIHWCVQCILKAPNQLSSVLMYIAGEVVRLMELLSD